jgi:hypothetical protein
MDNADECKVQTKKIITYLFNDSGWAHTNPKTRRERERDIEERR